jgi:eukaryotic-like serine/threonine-protein kinase
MTTTIEQLQATVSLDPSRAEPTPPVDLVRHFQRLQLQSRLSWTAHQHLLRVLGKGGQGIVYLSERRGADGFTVPLALKIFSPEHFDSADAYEFAMARIARVAAHVAQIQHDNLLDVQDFYDRSRIRVMAMEWVDGFDLRSLLSNDLMDGIRGRVPAARWEYINRVIVTYGPTQPRIKPGVAIAIIRECLGALGSLHREGIVHGDVKPSNIMLKRTGHAKMIDIGTAFELSDPPPVRSCTPAYAAPEVLENGAITVGSDLASLGYVLVELLAGRQLFSDIEKIDRLVEAKRKIHAQLDLILPDEIRVNTLLMNFLRKLTSPDPATRYSGAEEADLLKDGAAAFHRQLVKSDLSSEYANELRVWLQEVTDLRISTDPEQSLSDRAN